MLVKITNNVNILVSYIYRFYYKNIVYNIIFNITFFILLHVYHIKKFILNKLYVL